MILMANHGSGHSRAAEWRERLFFVLLIPALTAGATVITMRAQLEHKAETERVGRVEMRVDRIEEINREIRTLLASISSRLDDIACPPTARGCRGMAVPR